MLSEMDDWMSDADSDEDRDDDDDEGAGRKGKGKKKGKSRNHGGKRKKTDDGGTDDDVDEESDDFNEGAEHDYVSEDSSELVLFLSFFKAVKEAQNFLFSHWIIHGFCQLEDKRW